MADTADITHAGVATGNENGVVGTDKIENASNFLAEATEETKKSKNSAMR